MHIAAVSLFLFVLATLIAIMEIEIEGKHGWAEKLPTWYRTKGGLIVRIYVKVNNKPFTGYHAALFPIPLMIFAYPMVAAGNVALAGLAGVVATYSAFAIIWDFIWFILNPYYGASQFRPGRVWWFGKEPWLFGRIPLSYILGWGTALAFAAISGGLSGGWLSALSDQAAQLSFFVVFAALLAIFGAPRFHRYYHRMREYDERRLAGIHHDGQPYTY